MEDMIQRIAEKHIKNIIGHFAGTGLYRLDAMAADGLEMSNALIKDILSGLISFTDDALVGLKAERRKDGIRVKDRNVGRTVLTSLGAITYTRTYFETPVGMSFLLDDVLGVDAYERVDKTVSANLVNTAGELSFGRSADIVTGGMVSRQTVWNKAIGTGEVAMIPSRSEITTETVHIFADEDHVHLQKGGGQVLPLITVCAGKEPVCKGRNSLIEPIHINGYRIEPEDRWLYTYAVCEAKYDMRKVKKVFIYGDGASWIARGKDVFPEAIFVLDEYHFTKRVKALTAGDICKAFSSKVNSAIKSDDKIAFQKLICEMSDSVANGMEDGDPKRKRLKHIRENGAFLLFHWDAVQNRNDPDSIGSCSEALISHVLSERFSRSPMGWSKAGLSKMAMIRVFVKNGGRVSPMDICKDKRSSEERLFVRTRTEKYETLVRKQQDEALRDFEKWGWCKHEGSQLAQNRTGTRHALRLLEKMRNIS
jgi:hypothetical protein